MVYGGDPGWGGGGACACACACACGCAHGGVSPYVFSACCMRVFLFTAGSNGRSFLHL